MNSNDIRDILVRRVDEQKQAVGIAVGVIDPNGRRVVAYGHVANMPGLNAVRERFKRDELTSNHRLNTRNVTWPSHIRRL